MDCLGISRRFHKSLLLWFLVLLDTIQIIRLKHRNLGRNTIADSIIEAMKAAGYSITKNDAFEEKAASMFGERELSPLVEKQR